MNELSKQTSPYLLQHANNPVHWKAWSTETLAFAKKQNKLIIVSIGYSTCHWCHVMEQESFENTQIAEVMNKHFVCIKVDREELPNIDAFYLKAVQLMTKHAGWPLNAVCLPNAKPIWGGTYFAPAQWKESLEQLAQLFAEQPSKATEYASKLMQGITVLSKAPHMDETARFNISMSIEQWKKSFDPQYGGYTRAPKFMMPTNLAYLLKAGLYYKDQSLVDHVNLTLTKMAMGGLFDPVGGGFSRYSVDFKWHVPHFEKMLYDNAQLLCLYSEMYNLNSDPLYKEVIEKTIHFIDSTFSNKEGGYYSAMDADSLNQDNILEEGAYYVWTKEQLEQLKLPQYHLFTQVFNINEHGHWEDEKHVLFQNSTLSDIAEKNNISTLELQRLKQTWEKSLEQQRITRPTPSIDSKSLCLYNSLLITGLCQSYIALKEPSYLERAKNIFTFITQKMWCESQGLYHTYIHPQKTILASLDDYAFFIQSCLDLYKVTADVQYLQWSKFCLDITLDKFYDQNTGFFNDVQQSDQIIPFQVETQDDVIACGNSTMCYNLLQLSVIYQAPHLEKMAKHMLEIVKSHIDYPSAYSNWLISDLYLQNPIDLVISGPENLEKNFELLRRCPSRSIIFPSNLSSTIPYLNRENYSDKNTFFICINNTCLAPEQNFEQLKNYIL